MKYLQQFGGKLTKERIAKYKKSPHWKDGKFHNLELTTMDISLSTMPGLIYKQFVNNEGRQPKRPLPIEPFNKKAFLAPSEKAKIIWYGHSVVLMRIASKTVLIDPMLGPDASPIAPFATKRFSENTLGLIDEFPEIDILLMTHDHYDHIDKASFDKLKPKVKQYITSLGTGRHYEDWGVAKEDITEIDWWEAIEIEGLQITATPSRHFAGRGVTDREKSFWCGWAIRSKNENIYFSGDGGYGAHFEEVGNRLGPFDFGFMECGQYNKLWHKIHLFPEESVQAAQDAKVKNIMPVHWAGFALAQHHWQEPVERFTKAAKDLGQNYSTPRLGEMITSDSTHQKTWWTHGLD